jgi:hypothetical protein
MSENTPTFLFCSALSARTTLHARGSSCALFHPCTLALHARSRAPRSFSRGSAAPPRLRAARALLAPTPIMCAHCPNEFLFQFGVQSVQPFGRQCCMYGVAHACARINAHPRSPTPITSAHWSNVCLYQFGPRSVQPLGRLCGICGAAQTCAQRASMRTRDRRPP